MSYAGEDLLKNYDPRAAGAFLPPHDSVIPDWMRQPTPRPLPDEFVERKRREKRGIVLILFAVAAVLIAAAYLPMTVIAAQYLIPLAYLSWIGWGLAALAAFIWVLPLVVEDKDTEPIIHGVPLVVRIERLGRGPKSYSNGKPSKYHYQALVTAPAAEDVSRLEPQLVSSRELVGLDGMECTYRPGEYAIAFRRGRELSLYGFSGVDDQQGIVDRSTGGWWEVAVWLGRIAVFFLLSVSVISGFRYVPLEVTWSFLLPVVLGAITACGMIVVMLIRAYFRAAAKTARQLENERRRRDGGVLELAPAVAHQESAFAGVLGFLYAAGLALIATPATFLLLAFHLNAVFDRTPERPVPVDAIRTSDHIVWYVIRLPQLHYTLNGREQFLMMTPEELAPLKDAPRATLFVREGNFGWPWVEHADPRP